MTDKKQAGNEPDTEVELMELYARVKSSALPALICGLIGFALAFSYAKSPDKSYSATAKFTIESGGGGGFPSIGGLLPGSLGGRAGRDEMGLAQDKIMSRDFIISLFPVTGIDKDPFFNGENEGPGSLSLVFGSTERSPEAKIGKIVRTYRASVSVNTSLDSGIINLTVRHTDPEAAALLANTIMDTHIENIENRRLAADRRQVDLMKDRLLRAQGDLDAASNAARLYAVENNVGSERELGASSLNMAQFRRQFDRLDAILAGIDYIERQQRQSAPSDRLVLSEFFTEHPLAFTPLQQDLGWSSNQDTFPFPSAARIEALRQPYSEQRGKLQRTLRVIEEEASQTATSAGKYAELQREIEVQKSIYEALVSRFEARSLSAELRDENVQRIQYANPPLRPSAPRVPVYALMGFALATMAMLLFGLVRSWRSGKLYTAKSIAENMQMPVLASNITRAVGSRLQPVAKLAQRSKHLNNIELLDLTTTLQEDHVKTLCVFSVSNLSIAHNLATVLGNRMADEPGSVAIVDLGRRSKDARELALPKNGVLARAEKLSLVQFFRWDKTSSKDSMTFDESLDRLQEDFDLLVIICATPKWGLMHNRVAMKRADCILLLAEPGKTTKHDLEWIKRIRSRQPESRIELVLA